LPVGRGIRYSGGVPKWSVFWQDVRRTHAAFVVGVGSVPESQKGPTEEGRGTCAGCFLCCLASAAVLATCIAIGDDLFIAIVSRIPEGLLGFDLVKLLVGVVVYGAMILPGLLVFWIGQVLLGFVGVRVWKPAEEDGHTSPDDETSADDD
jgi:hypothetical protein